MPRRRSARLTLSSFTAETAASLPGPPWLADRRARVLADLDLTAWPSTEEEVWRYSRIDEFDLDRYRPASVGFTDVPAGAQAILDQLPARAGAVVVRNGAIVHLELGDALIAKGVRLGPLDRLEDGASLAVSVSETPTDFFAALSAAFAPEPLALVVPAGVVIAEPIVIVDWIADDGGAEEGESGEAIMTFPRLLVRAEADSEVRVVDWHGSDDIDAMSVPVIELDAASSARIRYVNVQDRGPRVWQVVSQVSRGDADASVVAAQAALGGDYARTRADCRLVGRGASGTLTAAYFGEREQMMDFRTFQDHAAPDTTSNLLFKGAVGGSSRSVYTGLIRVRKNARGTNAFQTNRNLKLSDHAWAESVPNLEIENNDVRCSHASTVGPVDEDQRFYLESRGVPTAVAERLIVAGFFAEVLEQLPVAQLADLIQDKIDERLDRTALGLAAPGVTASDDDTATSEGKQD